MLTLQHGRTVEEAQSDPFRFEADMAPAVRDWLGRQGLVVRSELATPVGICDLAGCLIDQGRAAERKRLGQARVLGPQLRVDVWSRVSADWPVSSAALTEDYSGTVTGQRIEQELARLVASRLVERNPRGDYIRYAPWHPLHERLVAVELKLTKVTDALRQAEAYQTFANETYVALPARVAHVTRELHHQRFRTASVGLLAVHLTRVEILIDAAPRQPFDEVLTTHVVERFWRDSLGDR